jgi:hypothetical protein
MTRSEEPDAELIDHLAAEKERQRKAEMEKAEREKAEREGKEMARAGNGQVTIVESRDGVSMTIMKTLRMRLVFSMGLALFIFAAGTALLITPMVAFWPDDSAGDIVIKLLIVLVVLEAVAIVLAIRIKMPTTVKVTRKGKYIVYSTDPRKPKAAGDVADLNIDTEGIELILSADNYAEAFTGMGQADLAEAMRYWELVRKK